VSDAAFDPPPPPWWTELARDFGRALSASLDSREGRFRSRPEAYPPRLMASIEPATSALPLPSSRMALYHEQVWKRFFVAFQAEFPRAASALGYFPFNRTVAEVLRARPPRSHDLSDAADPWFFACIDALAWLEPPPAERAAPLCSLSPRVHRAPRAPAAEAVAHVLRALHAPWLLVRQAAQLDEAERRALRAKPAPPWSPTEPARMEHARVAFAPSFSLLRLDFALPLSRPDDDGALDGAPRDLARASPLVFPSYVTVVRASAGVMTRAIDPVFARFLGHAREASVGEARARTEGALDAPGREHLARAWDGYLRAAFTYGWWVGLRGFGGADAISVD
jgi:hypothetical protein